MNDIKDRLAKLLATENITVRHSASASTASFDVKDRVLVLPVWKSLSQKGEGTLSESDATDVYDLLVGHEVGHALYTPYIGWESAIVEGLNKNILNIVEDPRIEKLIKRKYPGLRKAFLSGYKSLMGLGFFGDLSSWENMTVLDRLNVHFKGSAAMQVPFDDAEMWMVEGVAACETWDDVVEITKKIQMAYSELIEKSTQNVDSVMSGLSDADSEWMETVGDSDMPGEWADDVEVDPSETPDGDSIDTAMFDSVADDVDDNEASTVEEWEARKQELASKDDRDAPFYIGLPKPIIKNIVLPHKRVRKELTKILEFNFAKAEREMLEAGPRYREDFNNATKTIAQAEYNKFRTSSNKIINYMVKEFERKKAADEYKRTSVDKTGILNVTKLHEFKYSDDLFLKRAIVHDGKNHGLVFLLDWSASMTYHMNNTIKQLLSLVWFCNKVNIPFEVYAFSSAWSDPELKELESTERMARKMAAPNWDIKHGDVMFSDYNGFKLINLISSRQSAAELNQSIFNMFYIGYRYGLPYSRQMELFQYSLGSTPLVEAMTAMQEIIPNFRNYHKLDKVNFICLTDGEANSSFDSVLNEYEDELDSTKHKGYNRIPNSAQVLFDDPRTRKTYDVNQSRDAVLRWHYSGANQLVFLLQVLKDRNDINTIGIFLSAERGLPRQLLENYLGWFSLNRDKHKAARKEVKDNGFATIRNAGYDEYYLMPTGSVQIDDSGIPLEDGEGENLTKGKLKTIFVKSQKKKFGNRVLVNRMMDLIA